MDKDDVAYIYVCAYVYICICIYIDYLMENYSAVKTNEILPFVTTQTSEIVRERGTWLAQPSDLDLGVMSFSPTLAVEIT